MPYPKDHKAKTRERIVEAARLLCPLIAYATDAARAGARVRESYRRPVEPDRPGGRRCLTG